MRAPQESYKTKHTTGGAGNMSTERSTSMDTGSIEFL